MRSDEEEPLMRTEHVGYIFCVAVPVQSTSDTVGPRHSDVVFHCFVFRGRVSPVVNCFVFRSGKPFSVWFSADNCCNKKVVLH